MRDRIIGIVLMVVLVVSVIGLRLYSVSLGSLDAVARGEVYRAHYEKTREQIANMYPNLPASRQAKMIKQFHERDLLQNSYAIEQEITARQQQKKDFFQDEKRRTYIFGIDSYYWLRLSNNLITRGHIGEKTVDGHQYDVLTDNVIEDSLSRSAHLWFAKILYDLYRKLGITMDYKIGLLVIPLFFSALMAILSFYVTKLLYRSNLAAFFAGLAVNFSPILLQRTMGEWFDTDIYNAFFPLLLFGAFLFVFKSRNTIHQGIATAVFAIGCGIYASVWQGWWYIFDVLLVCGLVFFLVEDYPQERFDPKHFVNTSLFWLLALFIGGSVSVLLINGMESFLSFIVEPGRVIFALKEVPEENWPNVFLTVAELRKTNPFIFFPQLGGHLIFSTTILGSIYLILFNRVLRDKELGVGFFSLFIWLAIIFWASWSAIRLLLLMVVPLGILFGIIFDKIIRGLFRLSKRYNRVVHFLGFGFIILVIYSVISVYASRSLAIAASSRPLMNDAWHDTITFIKHDSDQDAKINCWWDYGHWYTAIGDRSVLFDGKTQNSPVAYWVASVLIGTDEKTALGILRMLNISKNKAFDTLKGFGLTHLQAIKLLEETFPLTKAEAAKHLEATLSAEQIETLLPFLYRDHLPSVYFIISYDMIGKMGAITLIGNWDFEKGDQWLTYQKSSPLEFLRYLQNTYGYDTNQAQQLFYRLRTMKDRDALRWISEAEGFNLGSLSNHVRKQNNLLFFDNGVVIDLETKKDVFLMQGKNKNIVMPQSLVYVEDAKLHEVEFEDEGGAPFSILLLQDTDATTGEKTYRTMYFDKDLAKCLFLRLYFFDGIGLQHFKKVHEEITPQGNKIFTYKVEWPT